MRTTVIAFLALVIALVSSFPVLAAGRPPNFVVIFIDDMGYADVGCFGAKGYDTPHIDRMAREGVRFTSFYVSQAVCSASRASLLTGCYNLRVGIGGALGPGAKIGINPDEMLIPEVLKQKGYATAIFGKWHLGDAKPFLPIHHGFDEYLGLPYSNDMWPLHPEAKSAKKNPWPDLPLIEGDRVVNPKVTPADQEQLTTQYTQRAVKFIETNKDKPFFLYVPHNQCHVPLYVSDKFKGKTKAGVFGDVVMELDWSVGQILDALKAHGIDEHTLVIFTSDNGPWLSYGRHAGSAAPFREGKGTTWEGGHRVPMIARWPGKIPAGTVCHEMAATIDVLPTLAKLADAPLPKHTIDGKDIWPLLASARDAKTPHDAYAFYWLNHLHAVRAGKWKLHFPHDYRTLKSGGGDDGDPAPYAQAKTDLALYDLDADPGETNNLADKHADIVQSLKDRAERYREDLGDSATKQIGKGVRPAGRL